MKNSYRDMELISLNVAGWNWRETDEKWGDRLKRICEYIRNEMNNPLVIALQEVQLSGGKYLTILEEQFPDYHIVLPQAYKNQPRSVVSVLLVNKNLCESYNVRTLEGQEDSLRYNFLHINTHIESLSFRILNIHIPHNCLENAAESYRKEREKLRALFSRKIEEIANSYRSEPDLKLIILGDFNSLPEDRIIKSLTYSHNSPMLDAVEDKHKATWTDFDSHAIKRLDYILYSKAMLCNTGVTAKYTQVDDHTIINKLTDHALLIGCLMLEEDTPNDAQDKNI